MTLQLSLVFRPRLLTGLFIILCLNTPLQAKQVVELDRIIAVVNKNVITKTELDRRILLLKKQLQESKTQLPPDSVFRKQVLERLIMEALQVQIAGKRGIRVNDEPSTG